MTPLPMFPLGLVLFPGIAVPLHVFEPRYRNLMAHLLGVDDPERRRFGVVAIKLGFEVGEHSVRALHRVGCEAALVSHEKGDDGTYDIEVEGRRRFRLDEMHEDGAFPTGEVVYLDEPEGDRAVDEADRTYAMFEAYRDQLSEHRHTEVLTGTLPTEPTPLSYALAATVPMSLTSQQELLEVRDATTRLRQLADLLRMEMHAMAAVPSLPATRIATQSWSPN